MSSEGSTAMCRLYARVVVRWWISLLLVVIAGCGGGGAGGDEQTEPAPNAPPGIELTSSAFAAGAAIPKRYTCDGEDTSPPLAWTDVPSSAKELALMVEDPDAPGGTYVHWTVFAIPPSSDGLDEGKLPRSAREGENSFGDVRYGGPCPPEGDKAHRYSFSLYALKTEVDLEKGAKPEDVRDAVAKHSLARGQLVGTFKRG
jgi:Raf kinase inhibitor-like YbhB/YbcL family protein